MRISQIEGSKEWYLLLKEVLFNNIDGLFSSMMTESEVLNLKYKTFFRVSAFIENYNWLSDIDVDFKINITINGNNIVVKVLDIIVTDLSGNVIEVKDIYNSDILTDKRFNAFIITKRDGDMLFLNKILNRELT